MEHIIPYNVRINTYSIDNPIGIRNISKVKDESTQEYIEIINPAPKNPKQ